MLVSNALCFCVGGEGRCKVCQLLCRATAALTGVIDSLLQLKWSANVEPWARNIVWSVPYGAATALALFHATTLELSILGCWSPWMLGGPGQALSANPRADENTGAPGDSTDCTLFE